VGNSGSLIDIPVHGRVDGDEREKQEDDSSGLGPGVFCPVDNMHSLP